MLRRLLVFAVLLAALATPALALEKPYREVLPNGLTLVLLETRASPTVSVNVFVRVGSVEETPETSGIAHFYEHLFFRGTPTRSGTDFKRAIEVLGGQSNASTSKDMTHYFINLPSRYTVQGMELLADALIHAELTQESVDQERKAVLEELRLGAESPPRVVGNRIYAVAFPNHPYGRPTIGTEDNLQRFSRQDFVNFRDRYIVPSRTTVILVGDFRIHEILPRARELFGRFERQGEPERSFPPDPWPSHEVVLREDSMVNSSFVVMAFPGPSVKDKPDVYRVDVLSFLLGIGKGSLLSRALVDTRLAQEVGVDFLTQRYPGIISIMVSGPPGREAERKQAIMATLNRVKRGDFSEADLTRAKELLRSHYLFDAETNSGKAETLGFYAAIDDVDFALTYLEQIEKVTRQDVVRAAQKYLGPGFYTLILTPPGSAAREVGE
ncbi:MAG TPA: pitrilysin family protein [Candidatus Nitrosotenuis sp.]|jgi:zinc protease|nr:pitrilysin family protein [Candidatus Nitrosotenuis sp.]